MTTRTRGYFYATLATLIGALAVAVPSLGQEPQRTRTVPKLALQAQPDRSFLVRRAFFRRVATGTTVIGRCRGPGCRVRVQRRYAFFYRGEVSLPGFRRMRARPGTRIELLVSHPNKTGIVHVYRFGRAGVRLADCEVAPGSTSQDC